ncbi:MAG TPA: hypothetical protein VJ991_14015 [Balneolales bacterium]|nr:hypothetical protein [Balneolales bacterium]
MNTKKIIIYIVALIGAFLISLVASFYIYPLVHPNAVPKKSNLPTMQLSGKASQKSSSEIIKDLRVKIGGMDHKIDSLTTQRKKDKATIDSLKNIVESKVKLIAQLQHASLTKKENAKFIAKSLLNLDEERLSPIVNKLNNKQLMALYNTASNMQRQKLLQSLTPDKAADIVKKVML